MSGGASVPFAIAAVYYSDSEVLQVFLCALSCAWFAAYRIWKPERQRVCELEERLAPRIRVFLDSTCNGIREVKVERGDKSKWVQIMVEPLTEGPLIQCEARLLRVARLSPAPQIIVNEPVFCHWSNRPHDQHQIDIPSGVAQPANLLAVTGEVAIHHNVVRRGHIGIKTSPTKVDLSTEIQKPGRYRFEVHVSARDAPAASAALILDWDGTFDNVSIAMERA